MSHAFPAPPIPAEPPATIDALAALERDHRKLLVLERQTRADRNRYYSAAIDILDTFRDAAKAAGWNECTECDGYGAHWEMQMARDPQDDDEPTGERLDPIDDPCGTCDGLGYELPRAAKAVA